MKLFVIFIGFGLATCITATYPSHSPQREKDSGEHSAPPKTPHHSHPIHIPLHVPHYKSSGPQVQVPVLAAPPSYTHSSFQVVLQQPVLQQHHHPVVQAKPDHNGGSSDSGESVTIQRPVFSHIKGQPSRPNHAAPIPSHVHPPPPLVHHQHQHKKPAKSHPPPPPPPALPPPPHVPAPIPIKPTLQPVFIHSLQPLYPIPLIPTRPLVVDGQSGESGKEESKGNGDDDDDADSNGHSSENDKDKSHHGGDGGYDVVAPPAIPQRPLPAPPQLPSYPQIQIPLVPHPAPSHGKSISTPPAVPHVPAYHQPHHHHQISIPSFIQPPQVAVAPPPPPIPSPAYPQEEKEIQQPQPAYQVVAVQQPQYPGPSVEAEKEQEKEKEKEEEVYPDDNSAIPGEPGRDYPQLAAIPEMQFTCNGKLPGYYADTEAHCQVWHFCDTDGRLESFLCPVGSVYNQEKFVCDWWYNVDCSKASSFYGLNEELYKVPPKAPEVLQPEKEEGGDNGGYGEGDNGGHGGGDNGGHGGDGHVSGGDSGEKAPEIDVRAQAPAVVPQPSYVISLPMATHIGPSVGIHQPHKSIAIGGYGSAAPVVPVQVAPAVPVHKPKKVSKSLHRPIALPPLIPTYGQPLPQRPVTKDDSGEHHSGKSHGNGY